MTQDLLQRLSPGSRVAIIRLRSLGDCVLTTPALALLKQHRPDLSLAVVVEDRFAAVFTNNPDVDEILIPGTVPIARWKPQLTINLHGGTSSSQMVFASRARWRAGFEHFRYRALYNIRIPRAQRILGEERKFHTAEHLASAMFYLGVERQEIPRARLFAQPGRAAAPYAVFHPKASAADKTWPAGNFAALAAHVRSEFNLEPVFIAGPGEDLSEFEGFRCMAGASLEELKSLLAGASLFVGNDSGPAHMAAAFALPVTVLFGSSDPVIWAPWKTESEILTSPDGIHGIAVDEAARALGRLRIGQVQ